jgi:soluble epoxide hydrolase/lipid-phosphate phosphatase
VIHKPVFTAAGKRDPFCAASFMLMKPDAACTDVTFKEYDGDHWIQWSHAEELNQDLLAWLEGLPK